jgi:signal peptidase I
MSMPPPPATAAHPASRQAPLPFGRPVRRRIAIPLILALGLAVSGAFVILHDRVVYYRIESGSMEPTLPIGSRVTVEPGLAPRVGEIIVFHAPAGALSANPVCGAADEGAGFSEPCGLSTPRSSRVIFIKRIVAGPGDSVAIRSGRALINGIMTTRPLVASCDGPSCNFPTPVRVPAGQYYVLGDSRGASDDSRFWGPVPASSILGVLVSCQPLQTDCQPRR